MKNLLGIFLILSSMNIANAACTSYTSLTAETNVFLYTVKNIVVEGYKIDSSHTMDLYAASLDYANKSFTCKRIQYLNQFPTGDDDFLRDEFLKTIKLGMSLGYKLTLPSNNTPSGSPLIVRGLGATTLSLP